MAGLRKAKKYDWKDSNLALFGSDTERQVSRRLRTCGENPLRTIILVHFCVRR